MRVRVLGPLEVHSAEGRVAVPRGGKQRLLLAALLLNAPRAVSSDRLIDMLWGGRLPEDPGAALRNGGASSPCWRRRWGSGAGSPTRTSRTP